MACVVIREYVFMSALAEPWYVCVLLFGKPSGSVASSQRASTPIEKWAALEKL